MQLGFIKLFKVIYLNFFFLFIQLLLVKVYFSIRKSRIIKIADSYLGWGDILLFTVLCFSFSTFNYIIFYLFSLLIAVLIWQFISKNSLKEEAIAKIGFWWIANSAFNVIWLFLWHYELLAVSVLVMLGILFTLVQLNTVISMKIAPNTPAKTLLKAGFGVYLGWICIATIANVTTWLVSIGWNAFGFSATFWTGGLIGVGSIIVSLITIKFKNLFIGAAVVWAFIGIIIKQNQLHNDFTPISWAAMTWALPVIIAMIYSRTFKS